MGDDDGAATEVQKALFKEAEGADAEVVGRFVDEWEVAASPE